jgi:hypothetical protein
LSCLDIRQQAVLGPHFLGGGSLRCAARSIEAYQSIRSLHESLSAFHGEEIGDPNRAADAILALSDMPDPPLRLVLGSDALELAHSRIEQLRDNLRQHEALSLSTDFVTHSAE